MPELTPDEFKKLQSYLSTTKRPASDEHTQEFWDDLDPIEKKNFRFYTLR